MSVVLLKLTWRDFVYTRVKVNINKIPVISWIPVSQFSVDIRTDVEYLSLGVDPEMCVVRALDTRYFTPWLSVSRRAPGCSSHGQLGPGGTEVHVIRVLLDRGTNQATRGWWLAQGLPLIEIILNATPHNSSSAPLALLLSADRPITWRLTANGVNPDVKHALTVNTS